MLQTLCLAFIWILKVTNLPKFYHRASQQVGIPLQKFRQHEKLLLRATKSQLDIKFLKRCSELDLFPKFLNFKIPQVFRRVSTDALKRQALFQHIKTREKQLKKLEQSLDISKRFFQDRLSFFRFSVFSSLLSRLKQKREKQWSTGLNNKFSALWISQRHSAPDSLLNKSGYRLSIEEENALRLGLSNPILPPYVDELGIKYSFERFFGISSSRIDNNSQQQFLDGLRHLSTSYIHNAGNQCRRISNRYLHRTLRKLKKNDSIRICKFDKGQGTVILDSVDYYNKLDNIVYSEKFEEVNVDSDPKKHPVLKTESSIQYFLKRYIKPFVSSDVFNFILPNGSRPGAIYGLAKVHKENTPLRPVVSMVGTAQYNLAQYLNDIIRPIIPDQYMLSSTADFVQKLKSYVFPANFSIVSFDVVSLFTNVPLNEIIEIASDYVYSDVSANKPGYEKTHFKKLLKFATSGEFLYKDKLFRQVDGVAMGSPLGPTLANLFLAHFEKEWLKSTFAPVQYLRYVDDVFCVFDLDRHDHTRFLQYINEQHPNLRFTVEVGPRCLPFLDVSVSVRLQSAVLGMFRKDTYTGLLLNFSAVCPISWKRGLVFCFLHRAYTVCSTWSLFHIEIDNLRRIFTRNGYPVVFYNDVVQQFLKSKFQVQPPTTPVDAVHDNAISHNLILPYYGSLSDRFSSRFRKLCKRYNLNVRVVFKPFKVQSYFSLKSRVPDLLRSCVIYKYSCLVDPNIAYIGKTKRHLIKRIQEHGSVQDSSILSHRASCNCPFSPSNFSILRSCNSEFDLSYCEALYIKKYNPSLNRTISNHGSSVFLKLF